MSKPASVAIETSARLHFGVLDLGGQLGRCFGGLGAAIPSPSLQLEAILSSRLTSEGPDAERAVEFARRFLAHYRIRGGAHLLVRRAIPSHSGLGSGTQLALAVGRALAELYGVAADVVELAQATGRGRRSAIGTWAFELGGFIVEGGRRPESDSVAPLLARFTIPEQWRYVLAVPSEGRGLSGDAEKRAFEDLPQPDNREVERVSHLVLMQLLPALVEADLPSFGAALSEVQRITGGWFAPQQGGVFAPGPTERLITAMAAWGAAGVGQSSWGPAAYGLVDGSDSAVALAQRLREVLGAAGQVFEGGFSVSGARVWTLRQGPETD
jgi:beta-ribofuranosylaminobenzene 5'-phosphate synthase